MIASVRIRSTFPKLEILRRLGTGLTTRQLINCNTLTVRGLLANRAKSNAKSILVVHRQGPASRPRPACCPNRRVKAAGREASPIASERETADR